MTVRSNLGAQLRSTLIKETTNKQWDENPLETIGLSPQILQLGFDTDKLHDVCKKIARTVLMAVHPDQQINENVPKELVDKYSHAFDLIKEPLIFEEALREFKLLNSEQRSAKNELQKRYNHLEGDLRIAEDKIRAYKNEIARLKNPVPKTNPNEVGEVLEIQHDVPKVLRTKLRDFRKTQGIFIGFKDMKLGGKNPRTRISDTKAIEQARFVLAIRLKVKFADVMPDLAAIPQIKALYDHSYKLHTTPMPKDNEHATVPALDDLMFDAKTEFGRHYLQNGDLKEVLKRAYENRSKYVGFPRIKWGLAQAYHHYGFGLFQKLKAQNEIIPSFLDMNPEINRGKIIQKFWSGINLIQKSLTGPVWIEKLDLYAEILHLDKGFYKDIHRHFSIREQDDPLYRVLGSLPPRPDLLDVVFRHSGELSEELLNSDVHPVLQKHSLLVHTSVAHVLQSGRTTEQQIQNYYERINAMSRKYLASHLILELL